MRPHRRIRSFLLAGPLALALPILAASLIGLANPALAAPLTLADLDADTDGVVQLNDVGSSTWELSFIANTKVFGVTIGIADKAEVFNVNFLEKANNFFSFTNVTATASFVISASGGFSSFAAYTAHTIANFQYADKGPSFDNTGVEFAFGPLLLEPDITGIDLSRVEFRGGLLPEPCGGNVCEAATPDPVDPWPGAPPPTPPTSPADEPPPINGGEVASTEVPRSGGQVNLSEKTTNNTIIATGFDTILDTTTSTETGTFANAAWNTLTSTTRGSQIVPEPHTFALLGLALAGLILLRSPRGKPSKRSPGS